MIVFLTRPRPRQSNGTRGPCALVRGGVEQLHIGEMDRSFTLDDTAGLGGLRVRLGVTLDQIHVGDEYAIVCNTQHIAALTLVFAGDHEDLITLTDTVHFVISAQSTSGASETI